MNSDEARQIVLDLLCAKGKAKNSEMLRLLGGNAELLEQVREELLFEDLTEEKEGVGLVYTGTPGRTIDRPPPASSNVQTPAGDASPSLGTTVSGVRHRPEEQREYPVFISYSRRDEQEAAQLVSDLALRGIRAFRDIEEIPGGASWRRAIVDAIERCQVVIFLVSENSVVSDQVPKELAIAAEENKLVLPVFVREVALKGELRYLLTGLEFLSFVGRNREDSLRDLVRDLRRYGVVPTEDWGSTQVTRLLQNHCWIGYDPTHYDPNPDRNLWPTKESIREDIRQIHAAGFGGIVTFGCCKTLASIPELAKERELAVIAGVWNPADHEEWKIAADLRDHVDAYCMGHNSLGKAYQKDAVYEAIRRFCAATERPVTTSEEIRIYRGDDQLCCMGDWLFPDCHVSLRQLPGAEPTVDVERDVKSYMALAQNIVPLAQQYCRPLMLKMVTFPWAGIEGASLEKQAEFFAVFLEAMRDPEAGPPGRVAITFSSAFDIPWKKGHPFYPWDAYTGLLDSDGTPRPAVKEILTRMDRTV